ncbi:MAG: hypothetical protein ACOCXC_01490 [Fibrobacterota bacterium]
MKRVCGKESGGALVAVLMVVVILNITMALVYYTVNSSVKKSGERRVSVATLNSAEAAKEKLYAKIRSGEFKPIPGKRVHVFADLSYGKGTHSVSCSTNMTGDTLFISASGKERNGEKNIEIVSVYSSPFDLPAPNIRGAVTARNHTRLNGGFVADGRDYDSILANGKVGPGVYGVSSCKTLNLQGSSKVGGNGRTPKSKKQFEKIRHLVSEEYASVTSLFDSPEAILGLSPGELEKYKVDKLPSAPFHGIYYLTENPGPIHFGNFSSGILILSNSTKTLKLKANGGGKFKGIIIADNIDKINGNVDILGAVVMLSDTKNVNNNANGSATVYYSSRVLNNLGQYCHNMKKTLQEVSWKELD